MNKKSYLIAQIIAACCMICACGAGPDGTETASDTKLVLTGYTVENDTMTTENPDSAETNDNINFSNAALGDVQTENVRLKKSAVIYTKPDANASQLGSLDKGTKVKAIGEADANGWLMIDYNGRAAYVEADRAGVSSDADDTDNVDNTDDNNESDNDSAADNKKKTSSVNKNNTDKKTQNKTDDITEPTPDPTPTPDLEPTPDLTPTPEPTPDPEPTPEPTQDPTPTPDPTPATEDPKGE